MAAAITGGYRGRVVARPGSDRDGLYVGVNYHYLVGVRYEQADLALQLGTDGAGLLTLNPLGPSPLDVARIHAASGTGRAIDVGVGVVRDGLAVGFSVTDLANRITWTGVTRTTYSLGNLFTGTGLNLSRRLSLDAAIYASTANVERKRRPALAASLRINQ